MDASKPAATISKHVDEVWPGRENLQSLLEAGAAVEREYESEGFQAIRKVLAAEIASIDRQISSPKTLEHAEYAHLGGRRSALSAFSDAAAAIIDRATTRRAQAEEDAQQAAGESAAERQAA